MGMRTEPLIYGKDESYEKVSRDYRCSEWKMKQKKKPG
jgi:hypothetical protein